MNARDDLFARVLRRLEMVDEAELDKAIADFEAEHGDGGPGLGQYLLDNDLIPQKIKLTVELSLPSERVDKGTATSAADGTPEVQAGDAPSAESGQIAAVARQKMSSGARDVFKRRQWKPKAKRSFQSKETKAVGEKGLSPAIVTFLRYYVTSRTDLAVIDYLATQSRKSVVFSPKELASVLGQPRKTLSGVCKALRERGLVREVGVETYNFAPSSKVRDQIVELQRANRDPKRRGEILAIVMQRENKK